jgi:phosphotriesterase-related protein
MVEVNTVLGTINSKEMGFTLTHEHIRESSAGVPYTYPELLDHDDDVARGVSLLNEAFSEGVKTILNVTTLDLGRDMRLIQEVAEKVNLHIVPATGLWRDIPRHVGLGATVDQLSKGFIREIVKGIENTGVRAGVIKVATDVEHIDEGRLTRPNELVLRSAAKACKETGVPIVTHTSALAKAGNYQMDIFEEEGTDLSKVCIGHSNDTDDIDYLKNIMDRGCFLGMDRYPGSSEGLSWERRTQVVKTLIDLGYSHQITLSHDFGGARPALPENINRRSSNNPDGYCFIIRKVIPRLLALGVTTDQITNMTINAPRKLFGG